MIPAPFFARRHRILQTQKGVVSLPATGYIQVHAYTGNAQIPLKDTAIAVTDVDGNAIALRLTNRSGTLDEPIPISVPDADAGLRPNTGQIPFSVVNLYAHIQNYEQIDIQNLQIFPNTVSIQNLEMIPLSELPGIWNQTEVFNTPPQNL